MGIYITPWGAWEKIEAFQCVLQCIKVKRLCVYPKHRTSLQYHEYREEHLIVVSGEALITQNGKEEVYSPGDYVFIDRKDIHRIQCSSDIPLVIYECQVGDVCAESDIVRLQDDYSRV